MIGDAATEAITLWLEPIRSFLNPPCPSDWRGLRAVATALDHALITHPVGPEVTPGQERSRRLRAIRRELANNIDTAFQSTAAQLLTQFVCGYRDLDLRDATGLGHGQLIARCGYPSTRRQWVPRLRAGELAGIAVTEPHGGSRVAVTRTQAIPAPDGTWLVTGRKTWISRLVEAAVFVVFFRAPTGRIAAAAIDATAPGLRREQIPPSGLAGWSWGILDLDQVPVRPQDILEGDGMALLREHFAAYRPLVTATALGGAAAVFDSVTTQLAARQHSGDLPRLRDSALVTLGQAHARLATALLGVVAAAQLADIGDQRAEMWSAATKAHGVDTANHAVDELALLLGASGYRADSRTAKTHRDLRGLLYADGIHDSLYRTAGKHHTSSNETTGKSDTAGENAAVPAPRKAAEPTPVNA